MWVPSSLNGKPSLKETPNFCDAPQSHRQNRLGFVYEHFDSSDQSLVKSTFDFSNIFRVMKSCAMSTTVE